MSEVKRFIVPVADMDGALSLFVDAIGCRLAFRDGNDWAMVESHGMSIALAGPAEADGITEPALMVKSPDLEVAVGRLVDRGAT
ncbi:MAG TPA: hypothetical protein VF053_20020, partial [Streptosporangiales bacterium]